MRMILLALITATGVLVSAAPSSAGEKPWCAQFYDGNGDAGRICSYASWEQCRATTGVQDGFCLPNPAYWSAPPVAPPLAPSRQRKHS